MRADFVELPPFGRRRRRHLDHRHYRELRERLLAEPAAGERLPGGGGLRRLGFIRRSRGRTGRDRAMALYYFWDGESQFWLFTIDVTASMREPTTRQKALLRLRLKAELRGRRQGHGRTQAHAVR